MYVTSFTSHLCSRKLNKFLSSMFFLVFFFFRVILQKRTKKLFLKMFNKYEDLHVNLDLKYML